MKYIIIAGLLCLPVFCVFWTMIIVSKQADKKMSEIMRIGENENGVNERS